MTRLPAHSRREQPGRRGLTLVELVISTVLVSVLLVAALQTVGASTRGQRSLNDHRQGSQLAQDLMSEILAQDYVDPALCDAVCTEFYDTGKATLTLGPESPEDATGDRSLFDDVDDYHGWTASPPQKMDGTTLDHVTGWTRSASVAWVEPGNLGALSGDEVGVRRITVNVSRGVVPVATLVAMRTIDPPLTEACCLADRSCIVAPPANCTGLGGTPIGAGTDCAGTLCPEGAGLLLFVFGGSGTPTSEEQARIDLIESWNYDVMPIPDDAAQADFDDAIVLADVAYVSPAISGGALAHKLTGKNIGIVNEFPGKLDNFGFSQSTSSTVTGDTFMKIDDSHEITSPFSGLAVTVFGVPVSMPVPGGVMAPGLEPLAMVSETQALVVLETGATRYDFAPAPARRVHLPFANAYVSDWTADAQTIMKRSIDWAAAGGGGGGGGACMMAVNDIAMSYRTQGPWYYGQATIRITDGDGDDVEGATVSVSWSGSVTGTSQGVTDASGTIMLESTSNKNGGTFTCTVTDVVLGGCTYEPGANVETSDTIIAP